VRRFVIVFSLLCPVAAGAQTSSVGGAYSVLHEGFPGETRHGVGAFFAYTPGFLGVDVSTLVFLPRDVGGTAWQLLAGPRFGGSVRGVGIYGRVRPGLIRFSKRFFKPAVVCIAIFPPPDACLVDRTNVSLDLGVTVEAFPSSATVLRFDLGDTLTRYPDIGQGQSAWKQGLQLVAGAGLRF
jgi:hypothetical protein